MFYGWDFFPQLVFNVLLIFIILLFLTIISRQDVLHRRVGILFFVLPAVTGTVYLLNFLQPLN